MLPSYPLYLPLMRLVKMVFYWYVFFRCSRWFVTICYAPCPKTGVLYPFDMHEEMRYTVFYR